MNPMNPNLYVEPVQQTTTQITQISQVPGQFIQQPIGQQVIAPQMDQNQLLATQALNNTNQRDIDRIIVHDTHGMPIKREHGAIFKGDVENHARKTGITKTDPYVPAQQLAGSTLVNDPNYVAPVGSTYATDLNAPITDTTDPTMYDEYGQPKKVGFMAKMKGKFAGWKQNRRDKKIRKQEAKEGRAAGYDSDSMSPERQGTTGTGYIAPTTGAMATSGTGVDTQHVLPTYQTSASGIPIRDTTKDYVRNLAYEVPVGTSLNPAYAAKDKKNTGAWDYPDQRIQKIEAHFPDGINTERVLLTQQVPVIVEPVIVQQPVPAPVVETVTTTITEQIPVQTIPVQQTQFTELTTTQVQDIANYSISELPTTQLAHLQINTELPVGVTFTPANQFQQSNFTSSIPIEQTLYATGSLQQQGSFQQPLQSTLLQQGNFQQPLIGANAVQPGMLGDLTGLSNQASFGFMPAGSSQPQVQETVVRTVEQGFIQPNLTNQAQSPRF